MLLEARGISLSYGPRAALRGVDVSLAAGEVVALIGPNGSGKSTLIKTLIGALRPHEGAIDWDGRPIAQWTRRQLARRVAYLAQSPLFEPAQSVADALRLGRAAYWGLFGIESRRDVQILNEVANRIGIADLLDRPMDQLSGGQRQMVFVARALVQEPAAILLDEPDTFLDLRHQVELIALLRRITREQGVGVLMASHDLNLAAGGADRLVLLDHGAVAAQGTGEEVLDPALLARVYGVEMERIARAGKPAVVLPSFWAFSQTK